MSNATRMGDKNTGHDACPAVALTIASPNVSINGKPAGRMGDSYDPHGCKEHGTHTGKISIGSHTVYINGKPAARVGDAISCGGTVAEGSPDVFIGG